MLPLICLLSTGGPFVHITPLTLIKEYGKEETTGIKKLFSLKRRNQSSRVGECNMTLLVFVLIWKPVFTREFMPFRFSGLEHTEWEFLFKVISSTFKKNVFISVCLYLCPSSSLPSLPIMSGRCSRRESPEKVTEPMRQGKCFRACIHLWAPLMIRFIPCLMACVCCSQLEWKYLEFCSIAPGEEEEPRNRKQPQSVFASDARISTHGCYCTPSAGHEAGWSLASRLSRKVWVRSSKGVLK